MLASFQLSIGSVYHAYFSELGNPRAAISFGGIVLLAGALIVVVYATQSRWVIPALAVLFLGSRVPVVLRIWLWYQKY